MITRILGCAIESRGVIAIGVGIGCAFLGKECASIVFAINVEDRKSAERAVFVTAGDPAIVCSLNVGNVVRAIGSRWLGG
jgi:hypothetical protein